MTAPEDFNAAVWTAGDWIEGLVRRFGWHDREYGYTALLAGLHALRDCLPRDEAIDQGAPLLTLLRGLYYEGWHLGGGAAGKSRGAFLQRIHDGMHRDPGVDAEQVARAACALQAARWSAAEVEDAKAATPAPLQNLWPI